MTEHLGQTGEQSERRDKQYRQPGREKRKAYPILGSKCNLFIYSAFKHIVQHSINIAKKTHLKHVCFTNQCHPKKFSRKAQKAQGRKKM